MIGTENGGRSARLLFLTVSCVPLALFVPTPSWAQDGKLKLRVGPKEAYVFVDGRALREGSRTWQLSPGEHKVTVRSYGYKPEERSVTITAGQTTGLDVTLTPIPGTDSGPWGRIQIEGGGHSAVLLNGKTPDYFAGHADEFNHNIGWKQELLVPPGTHQLTLLSGDKEVWSGSVTVAAHQRVILNVGKGTQRTTDWPRGQQLGARPRFQAGTVSATVVVVPPKVQFAAEPTQIKCGETSRLTWSSEDAARVEVKGVREVPLSGVDPVSPRQTTTLDLIASGPGGVATASTTVAVDNAVTASLALTPAEVRYRRVGDKVEEQGSATVKWSAANAESVSLDPVGSASASGSQTVRAAPKKTDPGPVDETTTYTLRASNACGGAETRTATLRVTGVIEPAVSPVETALEAKLAMNSVYFPTALPRERDPSGGLVQSQQRSLSELATNFLMYLRFRPEARLILQAHADTRGSRELNKVLSERRSARAKSFLMEQGVPESNTETLAFGSEQNLNADAVKQLVEQNPNLTPEDRKKLLRNWRAIVLANNRRVDIMLSTTKQESARYFPFNAEDFQELMREHAAAGQPAKTAKKVTKK